MDTVTISSIVTLSVAAAPILGTAAFFLVGLIVWWRTGSSITILSRLWRLLHGKMSPAVPAISGYLAAQAEVARLSFETGARFRTAQQAERVIAWSIRHDESLCDAAACGPYFDFELPGLKDRSSQPKPWAIVGIGAFFATLSIAILTAALFMIPDRAILRLTATGTWLTIDRESVKPMTFAPGFTLARCSRDYSAIPPSAGFTPAEVGALCDAVKAESPASLGRFIDRSIAGQRQVLGVIAVTLACWAWPTYATLRHAGKANAMRKRLRRKAATGADRAAAASSQEERIGD